MAMIHVWNSPRTDRFSVYLDLAEDQEQLVFTFNDGHWRQAQVKTRTSKQPVKDAEVTLFTAHDCQIRLDRRLLNFSLTQNADWPGTAYRYIGYSTDNDMTYSRPTDPVDPGCYDSQRDIELAYQAVAPTWQERSSMIKASGKRDLGTTIKIG